MIELKKTATQIFITILIFVIPQINHAAPFTYQYTQAYSYVSDASIYGTAAVVDITFINHDSNILQNFIWSDIDKVSVSTIGGSFTASIGNGIGYVDRFSAPSNTVLLETNAAGNGGTFFFNRDSSSSIFAGQTSNLYPITNAIQIGTTGWTNLFLGEFWTPYNEKSRALYQPSPIYQDGHVVGYPLWTVSAINVTAVPAPSTACLFASGLGLLAFTHRRKNKNIQLQYC